MLKTSLVDRSEALLDKAGYFTFRYHGCFDIAARKENMLLLKILHNVDAVQESHANSLKTLSNNLDASALVIGNCTRIENLKNGIVYERFGIPVLTFDTFESIIVTGLFPRMHRTRGGVYVEVDRDILRESRQRKNMSQGELGKSSGISKKSVFEHEKMNLPMLLSSAEKVESIVQKKITREINPLEYRFENVSNPSLGKYEMYVERRLENLGFSVEFAAGSPFEILIKETFVMSDIKTNERKALRAEPLLKKFLSFMKKPAVIITENFKREMEIPSVERKELGNMSRNEFLKVARRSTKL